MSKLLQKAIAEARLLSDEEQDALGAILLEEMESERRWDRQFGKSEDELRSRAHDALREHRRGETEWVRRDGIRDAR